MSASSIWCNSTGLYDYLNEKTGQKLTYHLFNLLNPGGKLVIAIFLPSISDIGYMEACMDWYLVYRDRFDMVGLTRHIPNEAIGDLRIHTEENQNIIFLELTHALLTNSFSAPSPGLFPIPRRRPMV